MPYLIDKGDAPLSDLVGAFPDSALPVLCSGDAAAVQQSPAELI
jgi:hypothetical protein